MEALNSRVTGTLNITKALLKEIIKKAVGNGYMTINPCDAVILPKRENNEKRCLKEWEQTMFLYNAKSYEHYNVFRLDLTFGGRIGEVLGLKWSDVDFDKKTIHIQRTLHYARLSEEEKCHFFFTTTKSLASERVIPMLPETEKILSEIKRKQLENQIMFANKWEQDLEFKDMVFTTKFGKPLRYGDVNRTIKQVITKANIIEKKLAELENREARVLKEFSPHCFRYTFVTRCRENGIPYETIQPYVGHANIEMTVYYDQSENPIKADELSKIKFLDVE